MGLLEFFVLSVAATLVCNIVSDIYRLIARRFATAVAA